MLNKQELKKASKENLKKELEGSQKQVVQTAMQVRTGQSKANHEVKSLKKYIARILTFLKERSLEKVEKKEENAAAIEK